MSIVAYNSFTTDLKEKLADKVTCTVMDIVMETVQDVLSDYDLTLLRVDDTGEDISMEAFLQAMNAEGKSPKTIHRYRYELGRFFRAAGETTSRITPAGIRKYFSDTKERGVKESTIRGHYDILHSYFGWCHREGLIARNPMNNIGPIKVPEKPVEVFSGIDMERLKTGCKTLRNRAIVYFLKATGCRIGEVTTLNREDINFDNMSCLVTGKGNKTREVYFDEGTWLILKQYLATREDSNPCLFLGKKGRLGEGGYRKMLNELGTTTSVFHVHPHKFRKTEFTDLCERGMPIEEVKELAGHSKIETTMRYLNIKQSRVKSSYQKYA